MGNRIIEPNTNNMFCSFKGVDIKDYNLFLEDPLPTEVKPLLIMESTTAGGTSNLYFTTNKTYAPYNIILNLVLDDISKISLVKQLFDGSGELVLGYDKTKKMIATVTNFYTFDRNFNFTRFSVEFIVEPLKTYNGNRRHLKIVKSGTTVNNEGDIPTRPTLKIYGNGNITVTINATTIKIDNVVDFVIIDGTIVDVYKNNISYNNNTTGNLINFTLNVGKNNVVTFSSNVTKIELTKNERWL